jgi:hypothetical protein
MGLLITKPLIESDILQHKGICIESNAIEVRLVCLMFTPGQ